MIRHPLSVVNRISSLRRRGKIMQLYILSLATISFQTNTTAIPNTTVPPVKKDLYLWLPSAVLPKFYKIQLTPYLLESDGPKRFTFDGTVHIILEARVTNVKTIMLHARDIIIFGSSLEEKDSGNEIEITDQIESDPVTNIFNVNLASELNTTLTYILTFNYTGVMGNDMRGFYKSKYTSSKGEEVYIGCFDEPKFKAKFQLRIIHPTQFNVVSNTLPASVHRRTPATTITTFKETPKMSTYLLAFIVSNFRTRGEEDFFVIARPEAYNQTEYAYKVGPKLLTKLEEFTNYPYSSHGLEKVHLAGIPDFSPGAMENWGLLTYRETRLLYDTSASTLYDQQRVATVVAHELAHQWFGDLVSCEWWGYVWLNEGFGRYFQYFITHELEPSWELDKQFVVEQLQTIMSLDSLPGVTPMSDPSVASQVEVTRMFNSISYSKAATIIRMTKHMMTKSKFKDGLQKYLKDNEYTTTTPQHLFEALEEYYSGTGNISSIFKDWTEQVGYPVINIKLASNGKAFTVSQQRFLLRSDAGDASLLYQIPLTYTTDVERNFEDTNTKVLLPKSTSEVTIDLGNQTAKWIIANIQEVGYYRVNYDETIWDNIHKALVSANHGKIPEVNRAQIVDDVFNLGRAGLLRYERVIDILEYLKSEIHYLPWYAAFQGYNYLAIRLGVPNEKYFKPHILGLLDNVYKSVGFTYNQTEKRLVTYNRANVLSWACKYRHTGCVKQSKDIFQGFMDESKPVEVNIRAAVYCTAIREGGKKEFNFLWNKFKVENVAVEQVTILAALGCSNDKAQLNTYLELILSDEVRLQDKQAAFQGTLTSSVENVDVVWEYVQRNYKKMLSSFGSIPTVVIILNEISSRFTSEEQKTSFESFLDNHETEFGSFALNLRNSLGHVAYNIKWTTESLKPFVKHIQYVSRSAASTSCSAFVMLIRSYLLTYILHCR